MVKTVPSNGGGKGLIPDQGGKVSHALGLKKKKKNRSNIIKKFNKDLKKMFHIKKF